MEDEMKEMTERTALFDMEGNLVGTWNPETGTGMLADCFIERMKGVSLMFEEEDEDGGR